MGLDCNLTLNFIGSRKKPGDCEEVRRGNL